MAAHTERFCSLIIPVECNTSFMAAYTKNVGKTEETALHYVILLGKESKKGKKKPMELQVAE